jgi:flavorubredoxin
MQTRIDQIGDRIYRISTCIPQAAPGGFTFNQFLIDADEPLLYHTGMRALFPAVREAVEKVTPLERLRWIAFAHLEADECGAVNEFLAAAPHAQVAHGALGCLLSLDDQCLRPPRPMADGEVLQLGGASLARRVIEIATPHVPHNWESHMFFEQQTETLFCGDLLTQLGDGPPVTSEDILGAAIAAEEAFHQTSLGLPCPQPTAASPAWGRASSPSCTALPTRATARRCCVRWPTSTSSTSGAAPPAPRRSHCPDTRQSPGTRR